MMTNSDLRGLVQDVKVPLHDPGICMLILNGTGRLWLYMFEVTGAMGTTGEHCGNSNTQVQLYAH